MGSDFVAFGGFGYPTFLWAVRAYFSDPVNGHRELGLQLLQSQGRTPWDFGFTGQGHWPTAKEDFLYPYMKRWQCTSGIWVVPITCGKSAPTGST